MYKRFPINKWINECGGCCHDCDLMIECENGCINQLITCNQCGYEEER